MKKYKILESNNSNELVIVFSPDTSSVNRELTKLIQSFKYNQRITIKMDLIIFLGDRPERYVQMDIINSDVIDQSVQTGIPDVESTHLTLNEYSKLSDNLIKKIFPISYRKKLEQNKRNNSLIVPDYFLLAVE